MARVKYPRTSEEFGSFPQALRDHVLRGFIPESPLFSRDDLIMTQGSCFAENLHLALKAAGIKCAYSPILEAFNTPKANHLYFEYTLGGRRYASENHAKAVSEKVIASVRDALPQIRAMIYTVGLIYEPYLDGEFVFSWREEDAPRISWRASTVTENIEHLQQIISLLHAANPTLKIIFTLSPIPIGTIHQDISPLVADCLSKSTLRAALGDILGRNPDVAYWPAFEAVRWLGSHMGPVLRHRGRGPSPPGPLLHTGHC